MSPLSPPSTCKHRQPSENCGKYGVDDDVKKERRVDDDDGDFGDDNDDGDGDDDDVGVK